MLQIRNVPDELHRRLKSRAASEGTSLSGYALAELRRSLERPTPGGTARAGTATHRDRDRRGVGRRGGPSRARRPVIVLDASAAVEWLLRLSLAGSVDEWIGQADQSLHAPHLLDIEVGQVVRRFASRGVITAERGAQALVDLSDLDVDRYPHTPLLATVWDLRANLTAHDAAYVALAVTLEAPLLTLDARLAAAPVPDVSVELIA